MKIKGTSFSSLLDFLESEYGSARAKEFFETLDPVLKKRYESLILASAFYPMEDLDVIARKARDFFSADESFFERSGAHNATVGLNGVYRALLARATPIDFLRAAERSWNQFVDSGTASVEVVDDGQVRIKVDGIPGSEVFCPRKTGFIARALELAGAKSLSVSEIRCTRDGEPCCEWRVAWDAETSPNTQTLTAAIKRSE